MHSQHITDTGCQHVAALLSKNNTLRIVRLCENLIGDECAHSIAAVLQQNDTLQSMYLSQNRITITGASLILEFLKYINFTVADVDLTGNVGVSGDLLERIGKLCQKNKKIMLLYA